MLNDEGKARVARNTGIDLLRILSMYMVVVMHVNGHGGIKQNVPGGINFLLANGVEQLCVVAVNLFALISGYVSLGRKFKIKNILGLWLEVFFYSAGIALIFMAVNGREAVPLLVLIKSALPVLTNRYWYFSSYVFLFFLTPALNFLVEKTPKREAFLLIAFLVLPCATYSQFADPFGLKHGFSALWLAILYSAGAFCKKWDIPHAFKNKYLFLALYFVFSAVGLLCIYGGKAGLHTGSLSYTFPPIASASIFLFLFFARVQVRPSKFLTKISSASFAVYLIHEHPLMIKAFINKRFVPYAEASPALLLLVLLCAPVIIYIVCTIIELLRQYLFRAIGTNRLLDALQNLADSLYGKYISR